MTTITIPAGTTVSASSLDTANGTNYIIEGTVLGDLSVLGGASVTVGSTGEIQGSLTFGDGDSTLIVNGGTIGQGDGLTPGDTAVVMGDGNLTVSLDGADLNGTVTLGNDETDVAGNIQFDMTNGSTITATEVVRFSNPSDISMSNSTLDVHLPSGAGSATMEILHGMPAASQLSLEGGMQFLDRDGRDGNVNAHTVDRVDLSGINRYELMAVGINQGLSDIPETVINIEEGANTNRIRAFDTGFADGGTNSLTYNFLGVPSPSVGLDNLLGDSVFWGTDADGYDFVNFDPSLTEGVDYKLTFDGPQPGGKADYTLEWLDGNGAVIFSHKLLQVNGISTDVICFGVGSLIRTDQGEKRVEDLTVGDHVLTLDHGYQPIRWIGSRRVSKAMLEADPRLKPIRIKAGALGPNMPEQDLLVSRQHRILVRSKIAQQMFGTEEVLIPAIKLVMIDGIDIEEDTEEVEYWHFLFDNHQVVWANGAATESMFTGPQALKSVSADARAEIMALFPEITNLEYKAEPVRLIPAKGKEMSQLAQQHQRGKKSLFVEM